MRIPWYANHLTVSLSHALTVSLSHCLIVLQSYCLTVLPLWYRMQPDTIAFSVDEDTHVSIVRGDLCLGNEDFSTRGLYPVKYVLHIGIGIEVDQSAMCI